jgi:aspartate oxidase
MMRRTSFLQVAAAIIQNLFKHMESYSNLDILWEMEAVKLLTSPQGAISGVKDRKSDGLLYDIHSLNAMFACGGFEGN